MRHTAFRLSLAQGALYAFLGLQVPFWPVFLASKGMDAVAIGQILAIGYGARVLSNPLAGFIADHWGKQRRLLSLLGFATFAATALFALSDNFLALLAISFVS